MMKRRNFLGVAATATLLLTSAFTVVSLPTRAQGQGDLAQGLGGFLNSPQGNAINDIVLKSRQQPGFADPGISNTSNLLTRTDVRNHLFLNGRQTEALTDVQGNYLPSMATQMMTVFTSLFQDAGAQGNNLQTMTPEERQAYITDMTAKVTDKVQETLATVQADQDKKSEAVLKPDQIKRLHELDLQWRGPLALTDAKINEPFKLTADQNTKLAAMLKEFRATQQTIRGAGFMGMPGGRPGLGAATPAPSVAEKTNKGGAGADKPATDPNTPPANPAPGPGQTQGPPGGFGNFRMPSMEEMNTQLEEGNKKLVKLRKTVDEKALAILTPEQQQLWKTIQGKPFTFRTNL